METAEIAEIEVVPEPTEAAEAEVTSQEGQTDPGVPDIPPTHQKAAVIAITLMERTLGTASNPSPVHGRTRSLPEIEDLASLTRTRAKKKKE